MMRVRLVAWVLAPPLIVLAGCGQPGDTPAASTPGDSGASGASAPAGPVSGTFTGLYVDVGEGPIFTECETARQWRVAAGGVSRDLDQAYLAVRSGAGEAARATVQAHSAPGVADGLVIDKVALVSGESVCPGQVANASLTNTTWRLVWMGGRTLDDIEGAVTLRLDRDAGTLLAYTLCHELTGSYRWVGTQLTFGGIDSGEQRCTGAVARDAAPLDAEVLDALRVTGSYAIRGDTLELMGETGVLARFHDQG